MEIKLFNEHKIIYRKNRDVDKIRVKWQISTSLQIHYKDAHFTKGNTCTECPT